MMEPLKNMLQVYGAMLLYYILKLPYLLRVFVFLWIVCLGILLVLWLLFTTVKRIVLPCLIKIILIFIQFLQRLLLAIVRHFPGMRNLGAAMDETLNTIGICLETMDKGQYEWIGMLWKKIPKGKLFFAANVLTLLFVIIPYYMEPTLTGNAKGICAEINEVPTGLQEQIKSYVDRYYAPVQREAHKDEVKTVESQSIERVILHLNQAGINGANLRRTPEKSDGNIIKVVSGDLELYYEGETQVTKGTMWIKVSTEDVSEAWISRKLIEASDLEGAGIE